MKQQQNRQGRKGRCAAPPGQAATSTPRMGGGAALRRRAGRRRGRPGPAPRGGGRRPQGARRLAPDVEGLTAILELRQRAFVHILKHGRRQLVRRASAIRVPHLGRVIPAGAAGRQRIPMREVPQTTTSSHQQHMHGTACKRSMKSSSRSPSDTTTS